MSETHTYTAFLHCTEVANGPLTDVLLAVKTATDQGNGEPVLIFRDDSGEQVDFDFSGSPAEVLARAGCTAERRGPGRPKLGVVAREVTLLPRHWDWLEQQPQGASAALRRLIDEARRVGDAASEARARRHALGRVLWSLAGNLPDFEETSRALFAGDDEEVRRNVSSWPRDLRSYVERRLPSPVSCSATSA